VSAALLRGQSAEAGGARAPPGQPGGDEPLEVPQMGRSLGDHCFILFFKLVCLMVFLMDLYGIFLDLSMDLYTGMYII
jgi:hypothetical protein